MGFIIIEDPKELLFMWVSSIKIYLTEVFE